MHCGGIFDYDVKAERLVEVKRELEDPKIWERPELAQTLGRERAQLEIIVNTLHQLHTNLSDLPELFTLAADEDDEAALTELTDELNRITAQLEKLEFQRM